MKVYIVVCYGQFKADGMGRVLAVCDVQSFDTVDKAIAYGKLGKWDDYQIFERNVK